MPIVTAVEPEPDPYDSKVHKLLRYAWDKRAEAQRKGRFVCAAFWTGFYRSLRERWYRH